MAQVGALVRELVLEELLAGKVLEIRVMDPAVACAFVGQPVDVFEQQEPNRKARLDPRPALVAVERRDLAIDPIPIDLAGFRRASAQESGGCPVVNALRPIVPQSMRGHLITRARRGWAALEIGC